MKTAGGYYCCDLDRDANVIRWALGLACLTLVIYGIWGK